MADQKNLVLKLSLDVDNTNGDKLVSLVKTLEDRIKDTTSNTKELQQVEAARGAQAQASAITLQHIEEAIAQKRNEANKQNHQALATLQALIEKNNKALEDGVKWSALIPANVQRAVDKYNSIKQVNDAITSQQIASLNNEKLRLELLKSILSTEERINNAYNSRKEINKAVGNLAFASSGTASSISAVKPTGAYNYGTGGTSEAIKQAKQVEYEAIAKADYDLVEKAIANRARLEQKRDEELIKLYNATASKVAKQASQELSQQEATKQAEERLLNERLAQEKKFNEELNALINKRHSERVAQEQKLQEQIRRAEIAAHAEQAQRQQAIYNENANAFKQQTSQEVTELNRRLALEDSVRRHGADNQRTIALQLAQEELRIRERLNAQIASIESGIRTGGMTAGQGATARTAAVATYTNAIRENNIALTNNANAAGVTERVHKSLGTHILEVIGLYRIFNSVINLTQQALLNIPKAGIEQQQTLSSVYAIFGTEEGNKNLKFLQELSMSAGQYIGDLQEAYRKFAPAAMLAGAKQEEVNKIFKDFTETSTVLHLSSDQVKSLYLALEQMYSKTKVQSEEIKKQLGNVLPGAVEIGAKAWASYTKEADKSVAGFMKAMEKNLVVTKEFAPVFAAEYRRMFGGESDAVFLDASTKLLSNLQRLRNHYFDISNDLYNITASWMNKVVRTAGDALVVVEQNLQGILQVITAITTVIGTSLSISIAKLVASTRGLAILGSVFNPYVLGATAAAGVVGLLAKESTGLEVSYSRFTHASKEQIDQLNATYAAQKEGAKEAQAELERLTEKSKSFHIDYKGMQIEFSSVLTAVGDMLVELYNKIKQTFNLLAEDLQYMFSNSLPEWVQTGFSKILSIAIKYEDFMGVTAARDKIKGLFQEIIDRSKQVQEESNKAVQAAKPPVFKAVETKGLNEPITPVNEAAANKAARDARKALVNIYKDIEREIKQITEDTSNSLSALDASYAKSEISIYSYYTKKEKIQLDALNKQKEVYDKEIALASKSGDATKVEELRDKIALLSTQIEKVPNLITIDKTKALQEYNKSLTETAANYQELIGNYQEAERLRFGAIENPKIAKFKAASEDTSATVEQRALAKRALLEEQAIEANAGLSKQVNAIQTKIADINNTYTQKIQLLNTKIATGVESQWSGMLKLRDMNKERIQQLQEQVNLQEQAVQHAKDLAAATTDSGEKGRQFDIAAKTQKQLDESRISLESLKAEGDIVANHFQTVVGDAFQSSFEGLIMGTQTAKQAFTSFATSVVADIAKIVASEIRSQILGKLVGMAFSAVGSSFSGVSGNGTNVSSNASFVGPMRPSVFSANGNVMSGAGISAYSGSVVSTPTVFPFASGTGLMGEAGPEAILPLKRDSSGKLGVRTTGDKSGQSQGNVYNISVTVQGNKEDKPADTGQKIGDAIIRSIAKEEIYKAQRPGNILNRTTTFG